jgi:hypothetical protein
MKTPLKKFGLFSKRLNIYTIVVILKICMISFIMSSFMFGLVTWVKNPTTLKNIRLKGSYNIKTYCNVQDYVVSPKRNL